MASEIKTESVTVSVKIYGCLFVLFLLLSLPELWPAWVLAAGHGLLRIRIAFPWVLCAVTGVGLYMGVKQGTVQEKIGGPLLLNLGLIVMFASEAVHGMGSFGR